MFCRFMQVITNLLIKMYIEGTLVSKSCNIALINNSVIIFIVEFVIFLHLTDQVKSRICLVWLIQLEYSCLYC